MLPVLLLLQAPTTPAQAATQPVVERKVVSKAKKLNAPAFDEVLDEVLEETVRDIGKLDLEEISPLAIGAVTVSPNLAPELEDTLALRLTAMLAAIPGLKQVHCASCFSVRSRVEGGDWVVSRGIVGREDMRRVATEIGAHAFVAIGVELVEGYDEYIAVNVRILRAKNSTIVYAKRLLSTETEVALARLGKRKLSDEERRVALEELLGGKPRYGHEVMTGYSTFLMANGGDGSAVSLGYRLFETFGPKRMLQYGLQLQPFFGPRAIGGNVLGVFNLIVRATNEMVPRFRFGIDAGAVIVVPRATVGFGLFAEMVTHLGLGLQIAVRFMAPNDTVGAIGFTAGGVWAWE